MLRIVRPRPHFFAALAGSVSPCPFWRHVGVAAHVIIARRRFIDSVCRMGSMPERECSTNPWSSSCFWCLVSGVWCLVSGVWCLVSGVGGAGGMAAAVAGGCHTGNRDAHAQGTDLPCFPLFDRAAVPDTDRGQGCVAARLSEVGGRFDHSGQHQGRSEI